MKEWIGKTLNRYQLLTLLGEGGMGGVFKARDVTLQRDVAVKIMHPQFTRQQNFQERFLQEARVAARLDHPGIVKVFDFGEANSMLYIVMEFIPGDNLRKLLQKLKAAKQWILLPEAVQIVRESALALEYAHERGVLHRDIKPDNIMLKPEPTEGLPYRPVVTDLGLAKLAVGGVMTQDGTSMGTPAYMSPEQALGEKTDAASDVYSLGILLYELAVGQLPFPAQTLSEAIRYHTREQPPDPRKVNPNLPEGLAGIILKAIAKRPGDRFVNMSTLAEALGMLASTQASPATHQATVQSTALAEAVSLVTELQKSAVEPRGPSLAGEFPETPASLTQDRITILEKDQTSRSVAFKSGGMTIGRDVDNDIVLRTGKASRKHARIEFDGSNYRVSDLNSTNGTYLGSARLLPGIAEIWPVDKFIQIGDSYLRLERAVTGPSLGMSAAGVAASGGISRGDGTVVDRGQISSSQGDGRIGIYLDPAPLSVSPGSSTSVSVLMLNQGPVVDQFRLGVEGVPAAWVTIPTPSVQLMPGSQKEVNLTIQPPQVSQSRAGRYPITFRVTSQVPPAQYAEVKNTLTVASFSRFSTDMHPQKLRAGQPAQVVITNNGNLAETFTLAWADRGEELNFIPPQARASVAEGQSTAFSFTARPKQRHWFGSEQHTSFNARILSPAGEVQTQAGEVVIRPIIPPWLLTIIPILCLCLAATAAFAYTQYNNRLAQATQTAEALAMAANQTLAAATQSALGTAAARGNQATQAAYAAGATASAKAAGATAAQAEAQTAQAVTHAALVAEAKAGTQGAAQTLAAIQTATAGAPTSTPKPSPTFTLTPTPSGPWSGNWQSDCELLPCGTLTLNQNGADVSGAYSDGNGSLTAKAEGTRLHGTWTLGGATGSFDFWLANDGKSWQGNWNRTFDWCGHRKNQKSPSPCGLASWYGDWSTVCDATGTGCGTLTLIQTGKDLIGTYSGGAGTVKATVNGTTVNGTWTHGTSGSLTFYMMPEGKQFNGNWDTTNQWCGSRDGASQPSPCLSTASIDITKYKQFYVSTMIPFFKFTIDTPTPP